VAAVVALATWRRSVVEVVVAGVVVAVAARRRWFAVGLTVLALAATVRAVDARSDVAPDRLGPFAGWATLVDDPRPAGPATRVILQLDGERFELWVRGRASRIRVDRWRGGDVVWVLGERTALEADRVDRVAWQHVVGEFVAESLGDRRDGRPLAVASNRVRDLVAEATDVLPDDDAALARGLVIGDDTDQPPDMLERFRASGLAHLTAVSGQNVNFVMAAAGPLLRRLRPMPRLAASLVLIGWFVVVTRAEPSVLRAGAMAALGTVAFAFGREREPPRLLAVAVTGLLLLDPLLVSSVGFWLSVGATAGVTVLASPLARRLTVCGPLAMPLAVTLGAQLGVAVPSLLVFGRLSLVGVVANLIAVPIAGFVMLYGLPACLAAGALPFVDPVLMAPVGVGVKAVDTVAWVAARAEPPVAVAVASWVVIAVGLLALLVRPVRNDLPESDAQLSQ
jgi:competence protein ComEC